MITLENKEDCCGCEACAQICPHKCISMTRDTEGFLYPSIDKETCVNCDLCVKVCPVINKPQYDDVDLKAYAARNNDKEVVSHSSSGGVFFALAKSVIEQHGIVFGAIFDESHMVKHSWTDNLDGVKLMQGSKYVQSRIGDSYSQARAFLKEGKLVLFTGTPCHIHGLNLFLRKKYDNLITLDFICHGVPSPQIWQRYLQELKYDVARVNFRDKTDGWQSYSLKILDKSYTYNSEKTLPGFYDTYARIPIYSPENYYMKLFLRDIILRPSCYQCPVKGGCVSSIKVADFWGIKNTYPELWDTNGVSLLICSDLQKEKNKLDYLGLKIDEVDLSTALKHNPSYNKTAVPHQKRELFFKMVQYTSVLKATRKILHESLVRKFVKKIRSKILVLVRKI